MCELQQKKKTKMNLFFTSKIQNKIEERCKIKLNCEKRKVKKFSGSDINFR